MELFIFVFIFVVSHYIAVGSFVEYRFVRRLLGGTWYCVKPKLSITSFWTSSKEYIQNPSFYIIDKEVY